MIRARSALIRTPAAVDNELQHQSHKNRMIEEDRRLFLRQAEEIKEKYEAEIEKLKNQNRKLKELRDEYINSKKTRNLRKDLTETGFTMKAALSSNDENYLRITLDKERHDTKTKKKLLFTLQDKLKDIQERRVSQVEENPLLKTIRQLEGKLDKVMIRYNQAQSVQQSYEEVVRRLKEERIGYDSQLVGVQQCLRGKEHDFEELLLLSHDATHARQAAVAELKQFEQRRVTVKEMRVKYIAQKKLELNRERPSLAETTTNGDTDNFMLKKSIMFQTSYKHDQNYQRQELHDYQIAFQKLKKVTGVSDPNEIIQKFKTQTLTTSSLEELQSTYAKKIEGLKALKEQLKARLDENKYSQTRQRPARRRFDEIDAQITLLNNQYSRTKLKQDKLSDILINVTAGVRHLKELTNFYKSDPQSHGSDLEDDLRNFENKLGKLYCIVKSDPNYMNIEFRATVNSIQAFIKEKNQDLYKAQDGELFEIDEEAQ